MGIQPNDQLLTEKQLQNILIKHKVLIVHFSTDIGGKPDGREFPHDLENVRTTQHSRTSCSTIKFTDEECHSMSGTKGIILYPDAPSGIEAFGPRDVATPEDGSPIDGQFTEITAKHCTNSITERRGRTYNEWVLNSYRPVGMFTFGEIGLGHHADAVANLQAHFPMMRLFSQGLKGFVELSPDRAPKAISVRRIYGF